MEVLNSNCPQGPSALVMMQANDIFAESILLGVTTMLVEAFGNTVIPSPDLSSKTALGSSVVQSTSSSSLTKIHVSKFA